MHTHLFFSITCAQFKMKLLWESLWMTDRSHMDENNSIFKQGNDGPLQDRAFIFVYHDFHSLYRSVTAKVIYVNWDLILCQLQCSVPFPLSPLEDAVTQFVKTVIFEVLTDLKHNLMRFKNIQMWKWIEHVARSMYLIKGQQMFKKKLLFFFAA